MCVNNLPRVVRETERPGLEPATYWLTLTLTLTELFQTDHARCPNRYTTTPLQEWRHTNALTCLLSYLLYFWSCAW